MSAANAVRAAAGALRDAEALHTKVSEKLTAAQASAPVAIDLSHMTRAVEDAAAEHALGLADIGVVEAASRALNEATALVDRTRSERTALSAATQGLTRRLESSERAVVAASEGLKAASVAWIEFDMSEAEREYMAAAEIVTRCLVRHAAGARALERKGEQLNNAVSLAAPLSLPTVGPSTCARFLQRFPAAPHAIGADLGHALAPGDIDIESELAALTEPKPGIVNTIKRLARAA